MLAPVRQITYAGESEDKEVGEGIGDEEIGNKGMGDEGVDADEDEDDGDLDEEGRD